MKNELNLSIIQMARLPLMERSSQGNENHKLQRLKCNWTAPCNLPSCIKYKQAYTRIYFPSSSNYSIA